MDPIHEWLACLPTLALHQRDPYLPVSIEHVLKHSKLIMDKVTQFSETRPCRVTIPSSNSRIQLTTHILHNEYQSCFTSFYGAQLQLKKSSKKDYYQYTFWREAPIYFRIIKQAHNQVHLRCMFILMAKKCSSCCFIHRVKPFDIHTFEVVLEHNGNGWQLCSFVWNDGDCYNDIQRKNQTVIYIERFTHQLKLQVKDSQEFHTLWTPIAQMVDTSLPSSSSTWTKLSMFTAFS